MRVTATEFASVERLRAIEAARAASPADAELRYAYARALDDLGRTGEAMQAYRDVLLVAPAHFAALTNLGTLFAEQEQAAGAKVCFEAAYVARPRDPLAILNLAGSRASDGAFDEARAAYEHVIATFAGDAQARAHAHNALSRLYERAGDDERARRHLAAAFARPLSWHFPARGDSAPVRVLELTSPRGGGIIGNQFFDDAVFDRTVIVPESYRGAPLPAHDLVFNGIGEADGARGTLACAATLLATTDAPVVNPPEAVLRTDREAMMARLADDPRVVAPRTRRYARADATAERLLADGFAFPLLVRAPGFHAGTHFELVPDPASLAGVVAKLPGREVYAIAFVEASRADAWVCKYRVVFVDGVAYPIHLALARQWKVHYFSAAMTDEPEHRAEERRFLDDVDAAVGAAGRAGLAAVAAALGLDYAGVDFGFDRAGRFVVFEANATMAINAPPDDPRWDYRRPAHARAIAAIRAMLLARAGRSAR